MDNHLVVEMLLRPLDKYIIGQACCLYETLSLMCKVVVGKRYFISINKSKYK
jgi:hypothetical protein